MKFPFLFCLGEFSDIKSGASRTFKEHWGTCTSALEAVEGAPVVIGWGFLNEHGLQVC